MRKFQLYVCALLLRVFKHVDGFDDFFVNPGLWKTLDTPYTAEEEEQLDPDYERPNTTTFLFPKIRPRIRKLINEGYIHEYGGPQD